MPPKQATTPDPLRTDKTTLSKLEGKKPAPGGEQAQIAMGMNKETLKQLSSSGKQSQDKRTGGTDRKK